MASPNPETNASAPIEQSVPIPIDHAALQGDLHVPAGALGLVIFAHGSGSSRRSPRNRYVARVLQEHAFGTLLLDLLTVREEQTESPAGELRFNIGLLAERLLRATAWARESRYTSTLPIGYFGASTGSAAALVAAARQPENIRAIVSRGGRPDLAGPYLPNVQAPTLLIVGGDDTVVIRLNEEAMQHMVAETKLEIIPGATHLFEEPGTLEKVAQLATVWFVQHMRTLTNRGRKSAHP
ncbi:MAG: putative phosphoribosyl transferase [Candidatus Acidoferrum typicum]|nr:putative phosphoribosyl transferase [Candidatus Acidoferrum typicum]